MEQNAVGFSELLLCPEKCPSVYNIQSSFENHQNRALERKPEMLDKYILNLRSVL